MTGSLLERRFLNPLRSIFDDDVTEWFVGFDKMMEDMAKKWDHAFESFNELPTSRVEVKEEGHYRVLLKAPGFAKDEITVQRVDDELVIKGEHKDKDEKAGKMTFEQHFYLAPDITIDAAKFDKDELRIDVSYPVEARKPTVQEITIA